MIREAQPVFKGDVRGDFCDFREFDFTKFPKVTAWEGQIGGKLSVWEGQIGASYGGVRGEGENL